MPSSPSSFILVSLSCHLLPSSIPVYLAASSYCQLLHPYPAPIPQRFTALHLQRLSTRLNQREYTIIIMPGNPVIVQQSYPVGSDYSYSTPGSTPRTSPGTSPSPAGYPHGSHNSKFSRDVLTSTWQTLTFQSPWFPLRGCYHYR